MLKLLLGNAIFATCIGCWYLYCDGDRALLLAGILLAFPCFVSGIFMGYILHTPPKARQREPGDAGRAALLQSHVRDEPPAHSDEPPAHHEIGAVSEAREAVEPGKKHDEAPERESLAVHAPGADDHMQREPVLAMTSSPDAVEAPAETTNSAAPSDEAPPGDGEVEEDPDHPANPSAAQPAIALVRAVDVSDTAHRE